MVRLYTNELTIGYGDRLIVKDLNIKIPDKQITTIIGSNGCGKSTLLKAITRIISHQSGTIILDGENIASENTKLLAKKMAILPQTPERTITISCRHNRKKLSRSRRNTSRDYCCPNRWTLLCLFNNKKGLINNKRHCEQHKSFKQCLFFYF